MSSIELDPNWRRRHALVCAYELIGTSLLRDQEPAPEDFALLVVAVIDSAISGDQDVLAASRQIIDRLRGLEPAEASWLERWRGRVEAMACAVDFGTDLLLIEGYQQAALDT